MSFAFGCLEPSSRATGLRFPLSKQIAANTIVIDGGNNNPPPEPPQNNDMSGSAMSFQTASVNSAARLFDLQQLNRLG